MRDFLKSIHDYREEAEIIVVIILGVVFVVFLAISNRKSK